MTRIATRRVAARSTFATLGFAALLSLGGTLGAQDLAFNCRQVGFLPLPGSSSTQGLWAYEANGRQYCLQTQGSSGLHVVDMTDTSNPTLVSNVPGNFRKVMVYGNHAYATTDSGPTIIVDLTDPTNATRVGSMTTGAHTLRVDEANGRLYLNRSSSLYIYDLTANPRSPALLGTWTGATHDSRPVGDRIYVNGFTTLATKIMDVSDPGSPQIRGSIRAGNHSSDLWIAPDGRKVLLTCDEQTGGHVKIWDVTPESEPQLLSEYQTNLNTSVHNVEVKGAYAYIGYYQDQLRILELTDPSNPVVAGFWDNNPYNGGGLYSDAWEAIPDHDAVYMNQMGNNPGGPKGLHAIDFFPGFGAGSQGSAGVPEIWWSFGPASPGNDRFAIRLEGARPNAKAWLLIGTSNTQWGSEPLPVGMGQIGAPNATLYVSPDRSLVTTTDANGEASLSLPVPPNYPYATFWVQWVVKDPGAPNVGGWAFSKGGKIIIY